MTTRAVLLAIAAWLVTGCFSPTTTTCADGTTCPAGQACAPAGGACVDPGQITACNQLGEDANCTTASITHGVCLSGVCEATAWTATAILGGSAQATMVAVEFPTGVAADHNGNLYIAEPAQNQVARIDSSGAITIVAVTGAPGFAGDGDLATSAELNNPSAVTVDGLGDVYIADARNDRVRRIDATTGRITTVAGGGLFTLGDSGPATQALLRTPTGVAVDGLGNLYIADSGDARVRRVDAITFTITTIAGNGSAGTSGDGGSATEAQLVPRDVTADVVGDLYIVDTNHNDVRYVDAVTGIITTFAGDGGTIDDGDGGPATMASLDAPSHVAFDAAGNVYIADPGGNTIRRVTAGIITTVAGTGSSGFSGDDGPAIAAVLSDPDGVAVDGRGDLYIADSFNNRIRRVDATTQIIATVAGEGSFQGFAGGAATCAQLAAPSGIAVDADGNVYIVDTNNDVVWVVSADGVIEPFAGTGVAGYNGDGIPATSAQLQFPSGVAVDAGGNVYIADTVNQRIRRVDPTTKLITTVAGNGTIGLAVDGALAVDTSLENPTAVAVDRAGALYIIHVSDSQIERVDAAGIITLFAGNGQGYGGDGSAATNAGLGDARSLAPDGSGNLYITDDEDQVIRRVDGNGIISTFAGPSSDSPTHVATLSGPVGVALDAGGDLYFSEAGSGRIRRMDTAGNISNVAGTAVREPIIGFFDDGDGGPAVDAGLDTPGDIALDGAGNVFVIDPTRVRRISAASGEITTFAGPMDPPGMGPLAQAHLADPRALALAPASALGSAFTLVAGGNTGTVQAIFPSSLDVVAGRYPQQTAAAAFARFRDQGFGAVAGVAYDAADNVILLTEAATGSDAGNQILAVTVTDPSDASGWTIAAFANGSGSVASDAGPAAPAPYRDPTGLFFDAGARVLYVADTGNHTIRAIELSSGLGAATVTTLAGTPDMRGFFGDGGPATSALLFEPQAITRCRNGDVFVADTGNNRVRRIATTGIISTVLGDGSVSSSGEGKPASNFPVDAPLNLACDDIGNLFVTSTTSVRMLLADGSGAVDGSGPVQTVYGKPGSAFPASVTRCLTGLAVVDDTTVEVTDACTGLLVELQRTP